MIKKIMVTLLFTTVLTIGVFLVVQAKITPSIKQNVLLKIEILTITNNTDQERDVDVYSTLPNYGRHDKHKKMQPHTTLTVKAEDPLQGVTVWVSDPLPGKPERACRYDTSVGAIISTSTVINNPSFVANG